MKKFHSLRSEFHSILTPVEWKFTTQRVESRPVHSIFTPKEVITDVTTQGVTSNRVKIHSILESTLPRFHDYPIGQCFWNFVEQFAFWTGCVATWGCISGMEWRRVGCKCKSDPPPPPPRWGGDYFFKQAFHCGSKAIRNEAKAFNIVIKDVL